MLHLMLGERHGAYPAPGSWHLAPWHLAPLALAPGASVPLGNFCDL
jgi:hypothetical protein